METNHAQHKARAHWFISFLPSEVSDIGKKCDDILSPDPVQKIENTLIFFSVNIQ